MIIIANLYPDLPLTEFPQTVDNFLNMLNISSSDATLVRQYQQAIQDNNFELAQQILLQIPAYSQKILTAERLNKIGQATTALERFYGTDVKPYIIQKQTEWQNLIDLFNYSGVWSPTARYSINNFVQYQIQGVNHLYIVTSTPPIGIAPTNTSYWRKLTIQGVKGDSGVGMTFRYAWDSGANYTPQDIVSYNSALWGATQNNTNQTPFEGSAYWDFIYKGTAFVYPVQENQPTVQEVGELWFRIV